MENKVNNLDGKNWLKSAINVWSFEKYDENIIFERMKSFGYKKRVSGEVLRNFNKDNFILKGNCDCSIQYLKDLKCLNIALSNVITAEYNSYHFIILDDYCYDNILVSKYIIDYLLLNNLEYRGNIVLYFEDTNLTKPCLLFLNRKIEQEEHKEININNYIINVKKTSQLIINSKSKMDKIGLSHPAPFSYIDIHKLCLLKEICNKTILDPFMGVGSTLIACGENNRVLGIELNKTYIDNTYNRIDLLGLNNQLKDFQLTNGDSLVEIDKLEEKIDCIITSPPYFTILKNKSKGVRHDKSQSRQGVEYYSENSKDLGNYKTFNDYINAIIDLFKSCKNKFRNNHGKLYLIISDFTVEKKEKNIHSILIKKLSDVGFIYNRTHYLLQNQKVIYPFGYPYKIVLNHIFQYVIEFEV